MPELWQPGWLQLGTSVWTNRPAVRSAVQEKPKVYPINSTSRLDAGMFVFRSSPGMAGGIIYAGPGIFQAYFYDELLESSPYFGPGIHSKKSIRYEDEIYYHPDHRSFYF